VIFALFAAALTAAQPQTVLTIDPIHRLIEGVASDGRTIWVSSVLDRQILACAKSCRTIATLPAGLHPFAIAWDGERKRLWIAADCPAGVAGITPCDRGALMALDRAGQIASQIAPASGSFHPGDVSASSAGVFVSDGQNGAVYRLQRGVLSRVIASAAGKSAQGSATDAGGRRLILSDYALGIGSVDLATGERTYLPRPDGKPLRRIDGMARCGSTYFGIYNGATPGALVAIKPGRTSLTFEEPLGETTLPDPTQIAYVRKRLLIVADSGWATLDKPGFVRTAGATIVSVPLTSDCKVL
jgi:hypothetical protein